MHVPTVDESYPQTMLSTSKSDDERNARMQEVRLHRQSGMICTDNVKECNHFSIIQSSIRLIYVPLWVHTAKVLS